MIYFILTSCIIRESDTLRKEQYRRGIWSLLHILSVYEFSAEQYKIIVVENNGAEKRTYLDDYVEAIRTNIGINICVFHTDNNFLETENKGVKELKDVHDAIGAFHISDDDFIVKMTARYYFEENRSEFIEILKNDLDRYDAIIRYGPYFRPASLSITNDCVTGLIGMRCKYLKLVDPPKNMDWVEWQYAKTSLSIDKEKVRVVPLMGIFIAPASNQFYLA